MDADHDGRPMSDTIKLPAQAAFEAFIAQATEGLPADFLGNARLEWDKLGPQQREAWRAVANAAVFATLHCDDTSEPGRGLRQGQFVVKRGGDYRFVGEVAAVFTKRSGVVRLVVEDERGLLLILRPEQVDIN
jgi:hypothetical protein